MLKPQIVCQPYVIYLYTFILCICMHIHSIHSCIRLWVSKRDIYVDGIQIITHKHTQESHKTQNICICRQQTLHTVDNTTLYTTLTHRDQDVIINLLNMQYSKVYLCHQQHNNRRLCAHTYILYVQFRGCSVLIKWIKQFGICTRRLCLCVEVTFTWQNSF